MPVVIREFVDETDSREIELIENIHRKNFTWQEEASLIAEIDKHYKEKNLNWSGRKTAELLDRSVQGVANALNMVKAIEVMPELAEFKTADEARKVIKKFENNMLVAELRRRQDDKVNSTGPGQTLERGLKDALKLADSNYHINDVFTEMGSLRTGGMISLIECDPPYGIELNQVKGSKDSAANNVDSYQEVKQADYPEFVRKLATEFYRIANKDCWLVFWYGPTWHQEILTTLRDAGWIVDEIPAIWVKKQGQTLQPEKYFARCYEPFFLCRKGNPIMAERGRSNVFQFDAVPAARKYHPTERPVALIEEVLNTLMAGNHVVFVPWFRRYASFML